MTEVDITPTKLIYDFFLDEAARLGNRTDWFLIFHAILLEAFFAAPGSTAPGDAAPRMILGILGFLVSYLWFMTGCRQRWLSRHLGACMANPKLMGPQVSGVFEGIFEMRHEGLPRSIGWARPVPTFAVVIPFAFAAAWFSLLLWAGRPRFAGILVAGLASIIATILIMRLGSGPHIRGDKRGLN
jgi:hypothetical protein